MSHYAHPIGNATYIAELIARGANDAQMPTSVDERIIALNLAARECYNLGDAAEARGDVDEQRFYAEVAQTYGARADAIAQEWAPITMLSI